MQQRRVGDSVFAGQLERVEIGDLRRTLGLFRGDTCIEGADFTCQRGDIALGWGRGIRAGRQKEHRARREKRDQSLRIGHRFGYLPVLHVS